MKKEIFVYKDPITVAKNLVINIHDYISEQLKFKNSLHIALSGGNSPNIFFKVLNEQYLDIFPWGKINFFWVDERWVPHDSEQSNYGNAKRLLFDNIKNNPPRLHPIFTEFSLNEEMARYEKEIKENITNTHNGFPCFDLIILGIGNDGHTASIFPSNLDLFRTNKWLAITNHPETQQMRITFTGNLINNAKKIIFFVIGLEKRFIIKNIFSDKGDQYPAYHVMPVDGSILWFLDYDAASLL